MEVDLRRAILKFLGWGSAGLLGLSAVLLAVIWLLNPGPPGRIVVATGGAGGLNHEMAERYKPVLARYGVDLVLRPEIEGIATLNAITAAKSGVDAGFLKGGLVGGLQGRYASADDQVRHTSETAALRSVGRLFYEPLWVFYRGPEQVSSLKEFKGKRILVGAMNSGSRRVVMQLLKANGIDDRNSRLVDQDLSDDGSALRDNGNADVAFVLLPAETPKVQKLLRHSGVLLMDFSAEADAYANRFPFLSKIVMHRNAVEFEPEIPSADITLLATSSALVIRKDLHPALISLLAKAVVHSPRPGIDKRGEPILFHRASVFPSIEDPEFSVPDDVRNMFKSGEMPFLLRVFAPLAKSAHLPFWLVAFVHQHGSKVLLLAIPLLSVMIPLVRLAPTLYNWTIRHRIRVLYRHLKEIERSAAIHQDPATLAQMLEELDRIDRVAQRIRYPLAFSDEIYDLRGHVDLVRQRLALRESSAPYKPA